MLLVAAAFGAQQPWARAGLERFRAELPTATIESVVDAGHDLLADALTPTIELVGAWLTRVA